MAYSVEHGCICLATVSVHLSKAFVQVPVCFTGCFALGVGEFLCFGYTVSSPHITLAVFDLQSSCFTLQVLESRACTATPGKVLFLFVMLKFMFSAYVSDLIAYFFCEYLLFQPYLFTCLMVSFVQREFLNFPEVQPTFSLVRPFLVPALSSPPLQPRLCPVLSSISFIILCSTLSSLV